MGAGCLRPEGIVARACFPDGDGDVKTPCPSQPGSGSRIPMSCRRASCDGLAAMTPDASRVYRVCLSDFRSSAAAWISSVQARAVHSSCSPQFEEAHQSSSGRIGSTGSLASPDPQIHASRLVHFPSSEAEAAAAVAVAVAVELDVGDWGLTFATQGWVAVWIAVWAAVWVAVSCRRTAPMCQYPCSLCGASLYRVRA